MKKIDTLKKVMTAAWTIRKRDLTTMSEALKKAWAWAKKQAASGAARLWRAGSGDMFRIYVGDSYAQVSVKSDSPRGYYQRHRACKGEEFSTGWVKAVGMTIEQGMALAQQFADEMRGFGETLTLRASKF